MASKLEKLMFAIGVNDKASGKVAKLNASLTRMSKDVQGHFKAIGASAIAVWGSVASMKAVVAPAMEFAEAMSEVRSLGADGGALRFLEQDAKKFARSYGGSAADVVRASYDIQSAIGGLQGRELSAFTTASAVLAKATKADTATMTGYMAAMYGVYQDTANQMGRANWVEAIGGKTAESIKMFRTDGKKWAEAVSALGASANLKGISLEEQFAVLGNLQATMGGSAAATKYNAFLTTALTAQKKLGLSFFDAAGKMDSLDVVFAKLEGKLGNLNSAAAQSALKKAFGSDEAIKFLGLMQGYLKGMPAQIKALQGINGMNNAEKMAEEMTHAWTRASGALGVFRLSLAQKLMPMVNRYLNKGADMLTWAAAMMDKYPNVGRVVGKLALAIAGMGGIVALATAGFHLYKLSAMALGPQFKVLLGLTKLLSGGLLKLAAVLWANPIVLIFGLLAVGIAAVIYYWSDLKAYFADTSWGGPLLAVMNKLEERWNMLKDLFTDFSWTKLFRLGISTLLLPLEGLINGVGWALDKLGYAIGKDLMAWSATEFVDGKLAVVDALMGGQGGQSQQIEGLQAAKKLENGNPLKMLSGAMNTVYRNNGQTVTIGEQHLHFENPPQDGAQALAMALR